MAESIVLGALGQIVRKFAALVNDTIAKARRENVVWVAHGLDKYDVEDREQLLEEAVGVDEIPIHSVTFKKFLKTSIAQRLCSTMSPETQDQMRKEIEASVTAEDGMRVEAGDVQHDATVEQAKLRVKQAKAPLVPPKPPTAPKAPPFGAGT